jgi:hypothetical protein
MLRHWLALSLLGLGLPTFATQPFENTAIVRTVDLGGSLIHITTTYAIRALATADVYTVALAPEERQKTSWIEAKVKGQPNALSLEDVGYDADRYGYPFDSYVTDVLLVSLQSILSPECGSTECFERQLNLEFDLGHGSNPRDASLARNRRPGRGASS